jgi:hypothetical protein
MTKTIQSKVCSRIDAIYLETGIAIGVNHRLRPDYSPDYEVFTLNSTDLDNRYVEEENQILQAIEELFEQMKL